MSMDGVNYCDYLRSQSDDKIDNLYDIIGGSKFQAPSCEPTYFLGILAKKYPHIIRLF
jgi:hypothetical protein